MKVERGVLYLANLEPREGSEAGKTRSILVIGANLLRVPLPRGIAGNKEECEVMIDQSRAIDNRRFVRRLRALPATLMREVEEKLRSLGEL